MSLIGAGSDLLPRFLVPNPGEESLLRRHGPSIAPRARAFTHRWAALLHQEKSLQPLLRKPFLALALPLIEGHYAALLGTAYDAGRRACLQHAGDLPRSILSGYYPGKPDADASATRVVHRGYPVPRSQPDRQYPASSLGLDWYCSQWTIGVVHCGCGESWGFGPRQHAGIG